MAGDKQPEKKQPGPVEKLKDFIDGFLDELKALIDPPRPVRVPATVGGPRRRR